MGSRAVPVRAEGGARRRPTPRRLQDSPLAGGRLLPLVTTFLRGSRRRAALGAAPGVGLSGSVAGAPPAVASGAFPVTLAGGYKREAPRGTAERASAAESSEEACDADRTEGRTQPVPSFPRALRYRRIAPHCQLARFEST